jgi:serine/threonine-protein kinase RsbW
MSMDHVEFDGECLKVCFDRVIPATPAAISPLVDETMTVVARIGCGENQQAQIELALREALANAIRHGSGSDPSKPVHCIVACDENRGMLIIVRDSGPGFDPTNVPNPLVGENLFRHHGRGIYLINELMDHVRFERGGTEIQMRKYAAKREANPRPAE